MNLCACMDVFVLCMDEYGLLFLFRICGYG